MFGKIRGSVAAFFAWLNEETAPEQLVLTFEDPPGEKWSKSELKMYPSTRARSTAEHIDFMFDRWLEYTMKYKRSDQAYASLLTDIDKHAGTVGNGELYRDIVSMSSIPCLEKVAIVARNKSQPFTIIQQVQILSWLFRKHIKTPGNDLRDGFNFIESEQVVSWCGEALVLDDVKAIIENASFCLSNGDPVTCYDLMTELELAVLTKPKKE